MAKENSIFIVGVHAVEGLLRHAPQRVLEFYLQAERNDAASQRLLGLAEQHDIGVQRWSAKQLDKLQIGTLRHQGVVACVRPAQALNESHLQPLLDALNTPLLLVMDGVQDPHNLGACLRSAEAAGVDAVIVPKDKAVGLTPVVRKVASGAAELIPLIQVVNLARCLQQLQENGIWVVGAAGEAQQACYDCDFARPLALVLGSEGKGLRRLTAKHCDELVSIPMHGSTESLNVSVAAGILMFEAVRQRL